MPIQQSFTALKKFGRARTHAHPENLHWRSIFSLPCARAQDIWAPLNFALILSFGRAFNLLESISLPWIVLDDTFSTIHRIKGVRIKVLPWIKVLTLSYWFPFSCLIRASIFLRFELFCKQETLISILNCCIFDWFECYSCKKGSFETAQGIFRQRLAD